MVKDQYAKNKQYFQLEWVYTNVFKNTVMPDEVVRVVFRHSSVSVWDCGSGSVVAKVWELSGRLISQVYVYLELHCVLPRACCWHHSRNNYTHPHLLQSVLDQCYIAVKKRLTTHGVRQIKFMIKLIFKNFGKESRSSKQNEDSFHFN